MADKVSIVLPAYNAEAFLAQAVQSALAQTHGNLEIIIVDDHSSDQTAALASRLVAADGRCSLIRCSQRGGPGQARNRALDAATGEWIALLDADDIYLPDHIETLLRAAQDHECDMVAGNQLVQLFSNGADSRLAFADLTQPRKLTLEDLVGSGLTPGKSLSYGYLKPLIRRDFLVSHNLRYESYPVASDFVFYFDCLRSGAYLLIIPHASYVYRRHVNSITLSKNNNRCLSELTVDLMNRCRNSVSERVLSLLENRRNYYDREYEYVEALLSLRQRKLLTGTVQVLRNPWIGVRLAGKVVEKLRA